MRVPERLETFKQTAWYDRSVFGGDLTVGQILLLAAVAAAFALDFFARH